MLQRFANPICVILMGMLMAAVLIPAHGSTTPVVASDAASLSDDCCCSMVSPCGDDSSTEQLDNGCCPRPGQPEECPCSCCEKLTRTVNLFSHELAMPVLFISSEQKLRLVPGSRPASAVLGVDIQPPIV